MKRGCFLTVIVLFTIAVGIVFYLYKYKRNIFKDFAKDKIAHLAINDLNKKMSEVSPSVYKDSLQNDLNNFFDNNKDLDFDTLMTRFGDLIDEARVIIKDKKVDSQEYNHFKKTLTKYERSTKNRN